MSIIQAVITDKICVISGDNRTTNIKTNEHSSGFNKIIKLNSNIMFGVTGNPINSFKLFDGYCFYNKVNGFSNLDNTFDISYEDFVNIILNRYKVQFTRDYTG